MLKYTVKYSKNPDEQIKFIVKRTIVGYRI